jgi:hypothetical protein
VYVDEPPTLSERELEHSKLRGDLDVVRRYGELHPDEWTDVFFDNEPSVRLVAVLAGPHRGRHEGALRRLVDHPDQLDVREAKYSRRRLDEMLLEIRQPRDSGHVRAFQSTGVVKGRLMIHLQADQEELAATLLATYGDGLSLKVGAFTFPMLADPSGDSGRRPSVSESGISLISDVGLDVSLPEPLAVVSGRTERFFVVFTNHGEDEVVLATNGALTARVIDPETEQVVGGFVGMQAAPLILIRVLPGDARTVPLLVGTASFKSRLGYAMPPGEWMVDAIVETQILGKRRTPLQPLQIIARSS